MYGKVMFPYPHKEIIKHQQARKMEKTRPRTDKLLRDERQHQTEIKSTDKGKFGIHPEIPASFQETRNKTLTTKGKVPLMPLPLRHKFERAILIEPIKLKGRANGLKTATARGKRIPSQERLNDKNQMAMSSQSEKTTSLERLNTKNNYEEKRLEINLFKKPRISASNRVSTGLMARTIPLKDEAWKPNLAKTNETILSPNVFPCQTQEQQRKKGKYIYRDLIEKYPKTQQEKIIEEVMPFDIPWMKMNFAYQRMQEAQKKKDEKDVDDPWEALTEQFIHRRNLYFPGCDPTKRLFGPIKKQIQTKDKLDEEKNLEEEEEEEEETTEINPRKFDPDYTGIFTVELGKDNPEDDAEKKPELASLPSRKRKIDLGEYKMRRQKSNEDVNNSCSFVHRTGDGSLEIPAVRPMKRKAGEFDFLPLVKKYRVQY